jgi:hypothetical protein
MPAGAVCGQVFEGIEGMYYLSIRETTGEYLSNTKIPSIREGGVQNFEPLHRYNGPNPPV